MAACAEVLVAMTRMEKEVEAEESPCCDALLALSLQSACLLDRSVDLSVDLSVRALWPVSSIRTLESSLPSAAHLSFLSSSSPLPFLSSHLCLSGLLRLPHREEKTLK